MSFDMPNEQPADKAEYEKWEAAQRPDPTAALREARDRVLEQYPDPTKNDAYDDLRRKIAEHVCELMIAEILAAQAEQQGAEGASWENSLVSAAGDSILLCDCCGDIHRDDVNALSESCKCGRFKQRMDWLKVSNIRSALSSPQPSVEWPTPTEPYINEEWWCDKHESKVTAMKASDGVIVRIQCWYTKSQFEEEYGPARFIRCEPNPFTSAEAAEQRAD